MSFDQSEDYPPPDVDPEAAMLDALRDPDKRFGLVIPSLPRQRETETPGDVLRGVLVSDRRDRREPGPQDPLGGDIVTRERLHFGDGDRVCRRRLPQPELVKSRADLPDEPPRLVELALHGAKQAEGADGRC